MNGNYIHSCTYSIVRNDIPGVYCLVVGLCMCTYPGVNSLWELPMPQLEGGEQQLEIIFVGVGVPTQSRRKVNSIGAVAQST